MDEEEEEDAQTPKSLPDTITNLQTDQRFMVCEFFPN